MQAQKVAEEAGAEAEGGIVGMQKMRSSFEDTAEKIRQLGESGKRIGNIVEVIRQISRPDVAAWRSTRRSRRRTPASRGAASPSSPTRCRSWPSASARAPRTSRGSSPPSPSRRSRRCSRCTRACSRSSSAPAGVTGTLQSFKRIAEVISDTARSVQEQAVVSDEIARNMDAVQKIAGEVLSSSEEAVVQGEQLHALAIKLEELVRGFRVDGEARGGRQRRRRAGAADGGGGGAARAVERAAQDGARLAACTTSFAPLLGGARGAGAAGVGARGARARARGRARPRRRRVRGARGGGRRSSSIG